MSSSRATLLLPLLFGVLGLAIVLGQAVRIPMTAVLVKPSDLESTLSDITARGGVISGITFHDAERTRIISLDPDFDSSGDPDDVRDYYWQRRFSTSALRSLSAAGHTDTSPATVNFRAEAAAEAVYLTDIEGCWEVHDCPDVMTVAELDVLASYGVHRQIADLPSVDFVRFLIFFLD